MSTTTSLHLGHREGPPNVGLHTYLTRPPIAVVSLDGDAISVSATRPADLRAVGEAFLQAACDLSAQLDIEAARAMTATA